MSDFYKAVEIILELEGGAKLIEDTGGLTKYGISQRAYPDLDIRNLSPSVATALYRQDYWHPVRADEMQWPLNLFVFDAAVNQGVGAAAKMLQSAAGGLAVDGDLGPKTMRRVQSLDTVELAASFMAKRALRYTGTQAYFAIYGYGWMRRLFLVAQKA